eukprot:CAMPEP_0115050922 /NCGR_PEP_ID=MMETSP0227-20121206/2056_1 /TAXON_ID=89957 /ORGANISM="Polarella glacialis, Strain CCMP 1383" /LENGTH=325 /DNA_ID=CAMNT_0002434837 /DNA_START=117 /DNA_END=1095 /DNA_ORIENTATION=+
MPSTSGGSTFGSSKPLRASWVVGAGVAYPTGDFSFKVFQPFPKVLAAEIVDPFLMCDEWGASQKEMGVPAQDPGAPVNAGERHVGWHPHRGFDILSYVKEGRGRHADSLGNLATVRPGGIQWMRTGSGVEHAEGGGNPEGANQHGFQIWINLPSGLKMSEPQYGSVQPEDIPEVRSAGGGLSRLLAGPGAAAFEDREGVHIADCELPPRSSHTHRVPVDADTLLVYVYRGQGSVAGHNLRPQQAALFEATADQPLDSVLLELQAGEEGLGALIFAGRQLKEPIAWEGPVVMNTNEEVRAASQELRTGGFLRTRVPFDYQSAADQE